MKKRNTGGFTLIELVIVIAVIAILAGISIPVYTAYIQKANEAADLQLLGAVNTAFAAACAERGDAPAQISAQAANIRLDQNGFVRVSGNSALIRAFLSYFGDNADTPFQNYSEIHYNPGTKSFYLYDPVNGFAGLENDEIAFPVLLGENEITVYVKAQDLMAITNSAFANELTVEQLTSNIQTVFNSRRVLNAVSGSGDYKDFLQELTSDGEVYNTLSTDPAASSNLLLFYAAQNTQEAELDELRSMSSLLKLKEVLGSGEENAKLSAEEVSRVGLLYGLATAYAYREHKDDLGPTYSVKDCLSENIMDFYVWLIDDENREMIQADLDGYISCMHILSNNMQNGSFRADDYEYIADQGYTATDIVSALSTILGQSAEA